MSAKQSKIQQELKQNRPFKSRTQELFVAVLRTGDLLRHASNSLLEKEDLTLQQYNVLRILRGASPDTIPTLTIAERLIERTPGITRLLDRLEHKGLVQRERCIHDRRRVLCRITESGLSVLARLDELVDDVDEGAFDGLSSEQQDQLIDYLDVVRQNLYRNEDKG